MPTPEVVEIPVIERIQVPAEFLEACESPTWPGPPILWGDLLLVISDYQAALRRCDAKLTTIRMWQE